MLPPYCFKNALWVNNYSFVYNKSKHSIVDKHYIISSNWFNNTLQIVNIYQKIKNNFHGLKHNTITHDPSVSVA